MTTLSSIPKMENRAEARKQQHIYTLTFSRAELWQVLFQSYIVLEMQRHNQLSSSGLIQVGTESREEPNTRFAMWPYEYNWKDFTPSPSLL